MIVALGLTAMAVMTVAACGRPAPPDTGLPALGPGPEQRFLTGDAAVRHVVSAAAPPHLALAWVAESPMGRGLYVVTSADNGLSFQGPTRVSDVAADVDVSDPGVDLMAGARAQATDAPRFLVRWRDHATDAAAASTVHEITIGPDGRPLARPGESPEASPVAVCAADGALLWPDRTSPGNTVAINHRLPEWTCDGGEVASTVDPRGWVHAIWIGGAAGAPRRVFYASSSDGIWFGRPQALDPGDGSPVAAVALTIDPNETVVATWTSGVRPATRVVMRQVIPAHHGPAQLLPLTTIAAEGAPGGSTLAPVRGGVLVSWLRDADPKPTVAFRRVGLDAICGPDVSAPAATPAVVTTVAATVDEGRALYAENGCATCHGAEGHGDGPVGKTLTPTPRDFRDGAAFKAGRDEGAIARTVADGFNQGGSKMPAFSHLSEQERRSLALFVISLRDRD